MTDDEYQTLHRLLDGEPENEPGGNVVEQVETMVGRLREENERLRGNAPMVTEAERARAEGPRPVLVCGSRRCGAGVRTMDVVWIRESGKETEHV